MTYTVLLQIDLSLCHCYSEVCSSFFTLRRQTSLGKGLIWRGISWRQSLLDITGSCSDVL